MNDRLMEQIRRQPEFERYLYRFGFLITTSGEALQEKCFVLTNWNRAAVGQYRFWIHPDQKLYLYENGDSTFFLIGHCYNPISMISDENEELSALAAAYGAGEDAYCRELSDLTGIFLTGRITGETISLYGDAAGMLMTYYGFSRAHLWVSSHAALLGRLNGLEQSRYVRQLVAYRFYPLFGFFLPGDLSPYDAFKRLVPNHCVSLHDGTCEVRRFYPTEDWSSLRNAYSMDERVSEIIRILSSSMTLIPRKWERPAISLTGGCDSKTTLACANGQYDRYHYFSYISSEAEAVDANGAHTICEKLGLHHEIWEIPEEVKDQELVQAILRENQGDIGTPKMREAQKRAFLAEQDVFDVEVKSWVSEVARAYYQKRFAKQGFPKEPTARYLTTLYKVFAHDRALVRETDAVFARYLQAFFRGSDRKGWPWADLFFWEFRVSSWNGLVITGEHRYSSEITIPYNNRRLLELMLAVPDEMRIRDGLYRLIREKANPEVDRAGVQITNLKHTSKRAKLERLYLEVSTRLPW